MIKVHLGCGVDYRKGFINVDGDRSIKADKYCDLSKKLPFKDNSVDEILCRNLFEHIPNPLNFLLEIKRILKKGGRATIVTSNASYFIYHFPRRKGHHDFYNDSHPPEDQHYFMFQKGHLEAFTKKASMKLLRLDFYIADPRKNRNRRFQEAIAKIIGKKFGYSDFIWIVEK
jgi:predicted SAM-dependent methyltransferase